MNAQWPAHFEDLNRLRKIEGQIRGIQKMIEDKRYCIDVLIQISSVVGAIAEVENNILNRHLRGCVYGALTKGNREEKEKKIDEIIEILRKFRKY
ncbi:metal-sensing transcriptional repressor [bacterium]|nr:metal-sensing transcriptional repressor [bacterium]